MKMRKLFAGLLATSIVAAGASAFAAPIANDAGFDKEAGTYSIVSDLSGYGADQMTIIIIPEAAYNAGTINDADILYIDQAAANTENIFANVGILGGTTLADGTYYVKIGGENIAKEGIMVETFTIKTTPTGREIQLGECDGITVAVDAGDAMKILEHFAGRTALTGDALVAAECDGIPAAVDAGDAMKVLEHFAGRTVLGKVMVND